MALVYIGDGSFIVNIPARDLTDDEIKVIEGQFGYEDLRKFLVGSGYYAEPMKKPEVKIKSKKEKEE